MKEKSYIFTKRYKKGKKSPCIARPTSLTVILCFAGHMQYIKNVSWKTNKTTELNKFKLRKHQPHPAKAAAYCKRSQVQKLNKGKLRKHQPHPAKAAA